MEFNEPLTEQGARAILGTAYNPNGTNYRIYTAVGTSRVTYDLKGEEQVIMLDTYDDSAFEYNPISEYLTAEEPKDNSIAISKVAYILFAIGLLMLCSYMAYYLGGSAVLTLMWLALLLMGSIIALIHVTSKKHWRI